MLFRSHDLDQQLDPAALPLPPSLQARLDAIPTINRPAGLVLSDYVAANKQAGRLMEGMASRRACSDGGKGSAAGSSCWSI